MLVAPLLLGLIVATSKLGSASAAMGLGGGSGLGISHAVSGVARVSTSGTGFGPWLQLPSMVLPSELNFPSYVPPTSLSDSFTSDPCSVTESSVRDCPPWSRL